MAQVGSQSDMFQQAGAQVAFIAAQKRGGMFKPEEFLREHPLPFPFLLDEDRSVTKAYGTYQRIGVDGMNLAHPATFVIDRNQIVRWRFISVHQFQRPPLDEVLEQ